MKLKSKSEAIAERKKKSERAAKSTTDESKLKGRLTDNNEGEDNAKSKDFLQWGKLDKNTPARTKYLKILPAMPNMLGVPWVDITMHYNITRGVKDISKNRGRFICTGKEGVKDQPKIPELFRIPITKSMKKEVKEQYGLVLTDEQNKKRKKAKAVFDKRECKGCEEVQSGWEKWRRTPKQSAKQEILKTLINPKRQQYRPMGNVYDTKTKKLCKAVFVKAIMDELTEAYEEFKDFADIDSDVAIKVIKKLRDAKKPESPYNTTYTCRLVRSDKYTLKSKLQSKLLKRRFDLVTDIVVLESEDQLKVITSNYGGEEFDDDNPPDCFGEGPDKKDAGCKECKFLDKCEQKSDEDEDEEEEEEKEEDEEEEEEDEDSLSDKDIEEEEEEEEEEDEDEEEEEEDEEEEDEEEEIKSRMKKKGKKKK